MGIKEKLNKLKSLNKDKFPTLQEMREKNPVAVELVQKYILEARRHFVPGLNLENTHYIINGEGRVTYEDFRNALIAVHREYSDIIPEDWYWEEGREIMYKPEGWLEEVPTREFTIGINP
jgi:hypothetical protein